MSDNQKPCDESTGEATPGGILFGRDYDGNKYLSAYHHRGSGSSQHKSVWADTITPSIECCIFYDADNNGWQCSDKHYWGVLDKAETILGKDQERFCKFPCPSNDSDPWHGYPVFSRSDRPPDDFIDMWVSCGVISKATGRKIKKRQL